MILILSYKAYEQGTDPVIEWLLYYKYPFKKITIEDILSKEKSILIDSQTRDLIIDGINITKEIHVVFYRRFKSYPNLQLSIDLGDINKKIHRETNMEIDAIIDYMFFLLKDKYWMPDYRSFSINKERVLLEAKECGLLTPRSIITNSKKELVKFQSTVRRVINKPVDKIRLFNRLLYLFFLCYRDDPKSNKTIT